MKRGELREKLLGKTVHAIQRRLQVDGMQMVILRMRVPGPP